MCGIVGVVGQSEAAPLVLKALKKLEYRGYDSAGIATAVNSHLELRKGVGKEQRRHEPEVERQKVAQACGAR